MPGGSSKSIIPEQSLIKLPEIFNYNLYFMLTVNRHMLEDLLAPIGGSADTDDERSMELLSINGNDRARVEKVILEEIRPYYESRSEDHRDSIKRSLAYFLTTNHVDFGKLYDSNLIAFDHPQNPRDFFLWTWSILFPNEDFYISDLSKYTEHDDIKETTRYYPI